MQSLDRIFDRQQKYQASADSHSLIKRIEESSVELRKKERHDRMLKKRAMHSDQGTYSAAPVGLADVVFPENFVCPELRPLVPALFGGITHKQRFEVLVNCVIHSCNDELDFLLIKTLRKVISDYLPDY